MQSNKASHAEATEATQHQTRRLNAIGGIPADVWTSNILSYLDNHSVRALALSCRLFNNCSQQTLLRRKNRKDLVDLVMSNQKSEVEQLLNACATNYIVKNRLTPGLLMPYPGRILSPFKVAAMDRNETMFDLLVSRLPQQNRALYKLVYLVISNQGEMHGAEWQFEVETFLKDNDPSLIFAPGPDGLSPLQIAAADKDIYMLLALLKALIKNLEKLEELRANLEANNELMLKEKWEMCVHALLEDLPNEVQRTVLYQLQAVQMTDLEYDAAPYTKAYSIFIKATSMTNWEAIGKLQRTMPLHARADIYFHSHGTNDPDERLTPCYYERCGSRVFRLDDNKVLFWEFLNHTSSFTYGVARGGRQLARFGHVSVAAFGPGARFDSEALTRHFEVRTQQLDLIVNALKLLQKVNHNGPPSQ